MLYSSTWIFPLGQLRGCRHSRSAMTHTESTCPHSALPPQEADGKLEWFVFRAHQTVQVKSYRTARQLSETCSR